MTPDNEDEEQEFTDVSKHGNWNLKINADEGSLPMTKESEAGVSEAAIWIWEQANG
ncbi:hypothetical protein SEA_AKHILA_75 [Mycobacterium phage Akhila]|uniref:Uncharacterized protein n=1 Tax=Mycobacterium phage Pacc40 TaxID=2914019 RepID=B5U5C2_9CAUD|nr:gp76 [Mycobacterium phage Pacc40]ACI12587.1 hypothetical protein PACC40_76 [Mycobacterium phage Pacc40]QUE26261.1 hypothetical protein SEA_AKHILA_75 [Mycobacterium phage Akhila]UAJ16676.1 hypothetical protein SEA_MILANABONITA_74 [Mycobacterium phage MilanaBonita]WNT44533.1 hypothetical protein SEA_BLUECRAB_82 [Mycobacterium phage BlueCrab]